MEFEKVLNGFENGKEKGHKNEKRKPSSPHSFSPSGPDLLQAHLASRHTISNSVARPDHFCAFTAACSLSRCFS